MLLGGSALGYLYLDRAGESDDQQLSEVSKDAGKESLEPGMVDQAAEVDEKAKLAQINQHINSLDLVQAKNLLADSQMPAEDRQSIELRIASAEQDQSVIAEAQTALQQDNPDRAADLLASVSLDSPLQDKAADLRVAAAQMRDKQQQSAQQENIALALASIEAGNNAFSSRQWARAVVDFRKALELSPNNADAKSGIKASTSYWLESIESEINSGRFSEAQDSLSSFTELFGSTAEVSQLQQGLQQGQKTDQSIQLVEVKIENGELQDARALLTSLTGNDRQNERIEQLTRQMEVLLEQQQSSQEAEQERLTAEAEQQRQETQRQQQKLALEAQQAETKRQQDLAQAEQEAERKRLETLAIEQREEQRKAAEKLALQAQEAERREQEWLSLERQEAERKRLETLAIEQREEQQQREEQRKAAEKLALQAQEAERREQERLSLEKQEAERKRQEKLALEQQEADRKRKEQLALEQEQQRQEQLRRQAEAAAREKQQEALRQARQSEFNRQLANARSHLDSGDLHAASTALEAARGTGLSDDQFAGLINRYNDMLAASQAKPELDAQAIREAEGMFLQLAQAVMNRNEKAVDILTEGGEDKRQLMSSLFGRYKQIDVEIKDLIPGLDNTVLATLELQSMSLPDGTTAFPSDKWRDHQLKVEYGTAGWSRIRW